MDREIKYRRRTVGSSRVRLLAAQPASVHHNRTAVIYPENRVWYMGDGKRITVLVLKGVGEGSAVHEAIQKRHVATFEQFATEFTSGCARWWQPTIWFVAGW